jgi:uncharacterized protein YecT (DUF1311 family)
VTTVKRCLLASILTTTKNRNCRSMNIQRTLRLSNVASTAVFVLLTATASQAATLREIDIPTILAQSSDYADCANDGLPPIAVSSLSYYDFDGDGSEEAIFVGASCLAGTGGPDIHGAFRLDAQDRLIEIKLPETPPPLPLAGNRNFLLYEQAGLLVREYYDSSERKKPLTEYFRWRSGKFQLERSEKAPMFEAGFDCRKARSDAEITICGPEDLAATDRELVERYQDILKTISPARRHGFVSGQKKWLQKRNSRCTYKWIRECLSEMYRDRLQELDSLSWRRKG